MADGDQTSAVRSEDDTKIDDNLDPEVEHTVVLNDLEPTVVETTVTAAPDPVARLDRSQARLRLSTAVVPEVLRIANNLSFPDATLASVANLDEGLVAVLDDAGILDADGFDPIAEELLSVINQASLMITIDLRYGSDASHRTVWATPRRAVLSNEIEADVIEIAPAEVGQLPMVLSQMMLARPPRYVGAAPISISTDAVAEAEARRGDGDLDGAVDALTGAGLSDEQARIVLRFQTSRVRRWQVASAWSTDGGQESRELRGLDADTEGQWLVAMTGNRDEGRGQITFTPQGHGDVMRSLRSILPKAWFGTPLTPPAI